MSLVTLGVRDLAVSCRFYEALGWRGQEVERTVFFQAGGLVVVLWGREELAADLAVTDTAATFGGLALAHNLRSRQEVDAVLAEAAAAGATVTRPGADTSYGGYAGVFTDPDFHAWEVAYNPGFPLGDDGSVTVPDLADAPDPHGPRDVSSTSGVVVSAEQEPDPDEVIDLYDSVGWTSYTRDRATLLRGLAGSHLVLTARDGTGRLVGLARTVSDGATACYVQDLLVRSEAQRRGVGRALMTELLGRYAGCRFVGLTTDAAGTEDAAASHPFYSSLGLRPHSELGLAAFAVPIPAPIPAPIPVPTDPAP